MFLSNVSPAAQHDTLADAIRHAQQFGHRPAVTALTPDGRYEQSFASLFQWAAKGAHLLSSDLMLEPGARLAIASPVSWHTTAIVLGAWWVGVDVTTVTTDADVTIVGDETGDLTGTAATFCVGGGIDGAPFSVGTVPAWTHEVRMFPDSPPPARATNTTVALSDADVTLTHADVLAHTDTDNVVGVDVTGGVTREILRLVAARPVQTGHRTVIIDRVAREAAAGERVDVWR